MREVFIGSRSDQKYPINSHEYENQTKFCSECGGKVEEKIETAPPAYACSQCGKEYDETTKFCSECGGKVTEKIAAPTVYACCQCQKEYDETTKFCSDCGGRVESRQQVRNKVNPVQQTAIPQTPYVATINSMNSERTLTNDQERTLFCSLTSSWNNPNLKNPTPEWADLPQGEKNILSCDKGTISILYRCEHQIPVLWQLAPMIGNFVAPVASLANCKINYRNGYPYIDPNGIEYKTKIGWTGFFWLFMYLLYGGATLTIMWWIIIPLSICYYKKSKKGIADIINRLNTMAPAQMDTILVPQKSSYSFLGKNKQEIASEGLRILKQKPYPGTTVYAYPNIDQQKLQMAINTYAPSLHPEDVIFHIEEMGSNGTRGIIFSMKEIRTSCIFWVPGMMTKQLGNVAYQYVQGITNDGSGYILVYDPLNLNYNSVRYRDTFNEQEWHKDVLDFISAMKVKQLREYPEQ